MSLSILPTHACDFIGADISMQTFSVHGLLFRNLAFAGAMLLPTNSSLYLHAEWRSCTLLSVLVVLFHKLHHLPLYWRTKGELGSLYLNVSNVYLCMHCC